MNPRFEHLMTQATRLMRGGNLADATAAIQSALGVTPPSAGSTSATPAARGAQDGLHDATRGGDVIDVEARIVDDGAQAPIRPTAVPSSASESTSAHAPSAAARADDARRAAGSTTTSATFTSGTFRNEFGRRDYKLFEPARDGRALPLVVMLHGCTQDPDDFARGTGMNELARRAGVLVLYPAQAQQANSSRCWNWFKHNHQARGRGEPGILAGMVREVAARHQVDMRRIYVAGLSAGGAMAAILGDAYPDLFAAVGVHSGLPTGSATDAPSAFAAMSGGAQPVRRSPKSGETPPTIVFHGDADATVNVVNGERVLQASGLATGAAGGGRTHGADGREVTRRIYPDANGVARAEHWTIHGAGHAWSGGQPTGSYTDPRGPDASAEMLRFFLAQSLRTAG